MIRLRFPDRYELMLTVLGFVVATLVLVIVIQTTNTARIADVERKLMAATQRDSAVTANNAASFQSLHDRTYFELRRFEAHFDTVMVYRPGP